MNAMSHAPVLRRVEHLAGGLEGDELDRHAEPPPEFAREVDRDALGLASGFVLLRQHRIAEVDRRAQLAAGREVI